MLISLVLMMTESVPFITHLFDTGCAQSYQSRCCPRRCREIFSLSRAEYMISSDRFARRPD